MSHYASGDGCRCKMCKAAVKSSPPTYKHSKGFLAGKTASYRPRTVWKGHSVSQLTYQVCLCCRQTVRTVCEMQADRQMKSGTSCGGGQPLTLTTQLFRCRRHLRRRRRRPVDISQVEVNDISRPSHQLHTTHLNITAVSVTQLYLFLPATL